MLVRKLSTVTTVSKPCQSLWCLLILADFKLQAWYHWRQLWENNAHNWLLPGSWHTSLTSLKWPHICSYLSIISPPKYVSSAGWRSFRCQLPLCPQNPVAGTQQIYPKYSLSGLPLLALWLGNPLHAVVWGHCWAHLTYISSLGAPCDPKSTITAPYPWSTFFWNANPAPGTPPY